MLAPVVIFVYNRPEHTVKTIEALAKNILAKETEVFIFSDAAKDEKSLEKVRNVRNYLDSLAGKEYFKRVRIIEAEKNRGLANSVIYGVSKIVDDYDSVIVLEDDLVSTSDYLSYMNNALDFYREDKMIWSISGYSPPINLPNSYKSDIYLSYRGCSWGWATWKNKWASVDWSVSDYSDFKKNRIAQKRFSLGGRDLGIMLDMQMTGKIDSWAIRWCYSQSKLGMYTIYPRISRIKNIGLDGTGTHSGVNYRYNVDLIYDIEKCKFEKVEINNEVSKSFKNYYMDRISYLKIKCKQMIMRFLGA